MPDQAPPEQTPPEQHGPSMVERLGGDAAIRDWVERFYALVMQHPLLAHMFNDLEQSKIKQHAFFVEFFGGPRLFTDQFGRPFMRFRHRLVKIGKPERDAWMECVMASLREMARDAGINDQAAITEAEARLGGMADHMINHHPEIKDSYYFKS